MGDRAATAMAPDGEVCMTSVDMMKAVSLISPDVSVKMEALK